MIANRNDPCPCGSGRKYKKCCQEQTSGTRPSLVPQPGAEPLERGAAWKTRRVQGNLEPGIIEFGRGLLGREGVESAIDEFTFGDETIPIDGPEGQLFEPWLLYTHQTGLDTDSPEPRRDPGRTLAGAFLAKRGDALGSRERTFIEACVGAVHSFFDVLRSDPGEGLRLRDILLGAEHEVAERSASLTVRPGDILYGRLVPFEGFALMVGTGSVALRTRAKIEILALRKWLRERHGEITPALLGSMEDQLRELYLNQREIALNPSPPVLSNTDGDPIEFHKIHYEIDDAERTFQALRTLAVGESESDIRRGGTAGRAGRLKEIEFSWLKRGNRLNKGWDNTVLGLIRIRGKKLSVEVNSAKRAGKIRSEIARRLGDEARFLRTESRSVESAARQRHRRSPEAEARSAPEGQRVMENPEVRAEMRRLAASMYDDWPDHPLPALAGKSPREAIADPEGREIVEALLTDFERSDVAHRPEELRYDFSTLRRRLGLEPRNSSRGS